MPVTESVLTLRSNWHTVYRMRSRRRLAGRMPRRTGRVEPRPPEPHSTVYARRYVCCGGQRHVQAMGLPRGPPPPCARRALRVSHSGAAEPRLRIVSGDARPRSSKDGRGSSPERPYTLAGAAGVPVSSAVGCQLLTASPPASLAEGLASLTRHAHPAIVYAHATTCARFTGRRPEAYRHRPLCAQWYAQHSRVHCSKREF